MNYLERALELKDETIAIRRHLHANPEVGMNLPNTAEFVMKHLKNLGLSPVELIPSGITATIGSGDKVLLLRADMDALPMAEESGLEFASLDPHAAHTCGHDLHTAMLLTAAKMLKENESALKGTVKLMFQPGEEVFQGARAMISAGVLENPKVDAAMGFHVGAGKLPVGTVMYNNSTATLYSCDVFRITMRGKGSHGAYPHYGIDPINAAVHVYQGLQELMAREADPAIPTVLTLGQFHAGNAANIIPEIAVMEGTLRTASKEIRETMKVRIEEVAQGIASAFKANADVEFLSGVNILKGDKAITDHVSASISALPYEGLSLQNGIEAFGSEDFAEVLTQVPGSFMFLSAGFPEGSPPAHNPKVKFNEDVLAFGAACFAQCAEAWLNDPTIGGK